MATLKDLAKKAAQLFSQPIVNTANFVRNPVNYYQNAGQQIQQKFIPQVKNLLSAQVPYALTGFPYNITRPQEYRAGTLSAKPTTRTTIGQYLMGGKGQYGIPSQQQVASGVESALMAYPPVSTPMKITTGLSALQRFKQALPTAATFAGVNAGLRALRSEER